MVYLCKPLVEWPLSDNICRRSIEIRHLITRFSTFCLEFSFMRGFQDASFEDEVERKLDEADREAAETDVSYTLEEVMLLTDRASMIYM